MISRELDIATRYFINELKPDTLKLQKLLYFTQGISFCMNDKEFFNEQLEAWVHGPVVKTIYDKYKKHGYNPIDIKYKIDEITASEREVLDFVRVHYGIYDGKYLENLTHSQEPWNYARRGLDPDERADKRIPKEIISEFFTGLMFQPGAEEWTN